MHFAPTKSHHRIAGEIAMPNVNANAPAKRGAARPLRDEEVQPPAYFDELQLLCWKEARSTRPSGYWVAADLIALEMWAVSAAAIRNAHMDPGSVTPRQYKDMRAALFEASRALRLDAYTRAGVNDRVAPVRGAGEHELINRHMSAEATGTPPHAPWRRAAHEAGHA